MKHSENMCRQTNDKHPETLQTWVLVTHPLIVDTLRVLFFAFVLLYGKQLVREMSSI